MTLSLHGLPFKDEAVGDGVSVVGLALKHGLSGYDATYVALAKLSEPPLATADRKMAAAARAEGLTNRGSTCA
ncbi:type II toxin-antitoxin system VapC family toxin [Ensifer sp. BR816]|uniref:type II toxin-antitoxin system VapC family toxin n=1 Tax=Rhizobium sp. (strain BR816) TaxID=1057002 RepID=UPI0003A69897|nr:type II toxin-antitoxin system VapC family toxin [Ensifer sp. BR816]